MGIGFEGGRGPIYNAVHRLKKKGKIEANGNGAYRICEKNVNDKEENETTQEEFYKYDDELQEARFYANKLIKLSEKYKRDNCPYQRETDCY